jgi:hypothetical protein
MAAFLGEDDAFERAVGEFALTYADVNERDYHRLVGAIDANLIPAVAGV